MSKKETVTEDFGASLGSSEPSENWSISNMDLLQVIDKHLGPQKFSDLIFECCRAGIKAGHLKGTSNPDIFVKIFNNRADDHPFLDNQEDEKYVELKFNYLDPRVKTIAT